MLQLQIFGLCDFLLWQVSKQLLQLYLVAWWEARHSLWSQGSESIKRLADLPTLLVWTLSRKAVGRSSSLLFPGMMVQRAQVLQLEKPHSHPFPLTGYLILSKSLIDGCHNLDSSFLEVGGYFVLFFSSLCPQRWAHWWNILGMQ